MIDLLQSIVLCVMAFWMVRHQHDRARHLGVCDVTHRKDGK